MSKNFWFGLLAISFVSGCAGLPRTAEMQEEKLVKALPVITQSFASPTIRPGDPWKVYLNAYDPEGKMKNIVYTISQPGVGTYPVSITRIREGNRKQLSGYMYLNTAGPDDLNFLNLTLTVQIQDTVGQYSKPVEFPLSLNKTYQQEPPPSGIFKESNLGPIMIQLRTIRDEGPGLFERRRFP